MPGRNFLFVPGPSNTPDRLQRAMHRATDDHRSSSFPELTRAILPRLKEVFGTTRAQTFVFPSTGSGMWEAALVNTLSTGDRLLAVRGGQFGHLFIDSARRLCYEVDVIETEWGAPVPP
ncbi:MAG TPA: serine--glyoxylate aminotransferase, partial [Gemmatimonadaceae bacterium]|nr:serine--glyoxylate aminotransferase [Gemmatimonadaceae bacterium]